MSKSKSTKEYNIFILGCVATGKSSLAEKFKSPKDKSNGDYDIEEKYKKKYTIDNEEILLNIINNPGQYEYSSLWKENISKADGIILVYSITSKSTFESAEMLREMVFEIKDFDTFPIVVIGNKSDLEQEREVLTEEGSQMANSFNLKFLETSAKLSRNVEEAFHSLIQEIRFLEKLYPLAKSEHKKPISKKKLCIIQ